VTYGGDDSDDDGDGGDGLFGNNNALTTMASALKTTSALCFHYRESQ
jgi:hypothetical protein